MFAALNPELHCAPRDTRLPGKLSLRDLRRAPIQLIEGLSDFFS
jgi:hypothetical protein